MSEFVLIKSRNGDQFNSIIVTEEKLNSIAAQLAGHVGNYCFNYNPESPLVKIYPNIKKDIRNHIVWRALNSHNTVKFFEKNKVLFIPSFKDSKFTEYTKPMRPNRDFYYENISCHLYPVLNKMLDFDTEVYVAYPTGHISLYKYIMEQYNVSFLESNKMYELGMDDYEIQNPDDIKFDFVYLYGCETSNPDGYFYGSDIKADFAKYCTEDFVLYDDYVNNDKKFSTLSNGTFLTDYNESDRIRGDLIKYPREELCSWIATNIMSPDFIPDDEKKEDLRDLLRVITSVLLKELRIY